MGYEIKYTGDDAPRRALLDMLRYVGRRRYKMLVGFANHPKQTFKAIHFVCGFAGVQGYPVRAFIRRYHPRAKSCLQKKS